LDDPARRQLGRPLNFTRARFFGWLHAPTVGRGPKGTIELNQKGPFAFARGWKGTSTPKWRLEESAPTKAGLTGGLPRVVQGLGAGLRFRAGLLIFQFSDRGSTP
jgi:hypothetical protein